MCFAKTIALSSDAISSNNRDDDDDDDKNKNFHLRLKNLIKNAFRTMVVTTEREREIVVVGWMSIDSRSN